MARIDCCPYIADPARVLHFIDYRTRVGRGAVSFTSTRSHGLNPLKTYIVGGRLFASSIFNPWGKILQTCGDINFRTNFCAPLIDFVAL